MGNSREWGKAAVRDRKLLSLVKLVRHFQKGCPPEETYERGLRNYELLLELIGSPELVKEIGGSGLVDPDTLPATAERIIFALAYNDRNDPLLALGLPPGSSRFEIRRRWKKLIKLFHPDRFTDRDTGEIAARINESYKNAVSIAAVKGPPDPVFGAAGRPGGIKIHPPLNPLQPFFKYFLILPKAVIASISAVAVVMVLIFVSGANNSALVVSGTGLEDAPLNKSSDSGAPGRTPHSIPLTELVEPRPPEGPGTSRATAEEALAGAEAEITVNGPESIIADKKPPRQQRVQSLPVERPGKPGRRVIRNQGTPAIPDQYSFKRPGPVPPEPEPVKNSYEDAVLRASVEPFEPPPPPPAPVQKSMLDQVHDFIETFVEHTEDGDPDKYLSLFAVNGVENGKPAADRLEDFRKKFTLTENDLVINNLHIKIESRDRAVVTARYMLQRLDPGEGKIFLSRGKLRCLIEKTDDRFRIVELVYE